MIEMLCGNSHPPTLHIALKDLASEKRKFKLCKKFEKVICVWVGGGVLLMFLEFVE